MARPNSDQALRIDQDRARALFDQGMATLVDVRDSADYRQSHIPGALSVPLLELPRHLAEIPRGRPIIAY